MPSVYLRIHDERIPDDEEIVLNIAFDSGGNGLSRSLTFLVIRKVIGLYEEMCEGTLMPEPMVNRLIELQERFARTRDRS